MCPALHPTGCSLFSSGGPEDTVRTFAEALQRKDANAAAADTSDPKRRGTVITSMFDGMGRTHPSPSTSAETTKSDDSSSERATAKLAYTWTLGPGRTLRYDATATAEKSGDNWRIQWSPTALHPKLRPGVTFQYSDDKNFLTPVVDRDGQPLLTWQTIGVVNLTRDHRDSAPMLAPLLQQFDPSITADSINDQFTGTQDDVVTVIKLREADLALVGDQLAQIPESPLPNRRAAHREPRPVVASHRRTGRTSGRRRSDGRRLVGEARRRRRPADRRAHVDTAE